MPSPCSESIHEAIQKSLSAGDFDTVRHLSTELGQAIIRKAEATAPAERKAVVQKELSRLREHLSLARVLRAHVANQLEANTTSSLYLQSSAKGHSWRYEG